MSEGQDQLFREAALKQLNNPDDLDRLVSVTRPIGWLAGCMLALLIVGVLVWSVVGRLPSRVVGNGIVLPAGGGEEGVEARVSGVLTAVLVNVGDKVKAGQKLAQIGQTEAERQLVTLRASLADRTNELAAAEAAAVAERASRDETLRRQRAALDLRIQNARDQEQVLVDRLATTRALFQQQLVTRLQVIQTQNDLAATRQQLSNAASESAQLGAADESAQRSSAELLRQRRQAVADVQQQINQLTAVLADTLTIVSPAAGTVIEVRAQQGSLVRPGQAVFEVEEESRGLQVDAFIGAQQGKEVQPGMEVRSSLGSVRREEFGMLLGHVESVSAFPLSFDAVRTIIQNEDLARSFMQGGPPFLARVRLEPDPDSVSGYRWTSQRGETVAISSGMPASVEIVTEWRRPISMVIPAFRTILGK